MTRCVIGLNRMLAAINPVHNQWTSGGSLTQWTVQSCQECARSHYSGQRFL